jgi:hypothetical protein
MNALYKSTGIHNYREGKFSIWDFFPAYMVIKPEPAQQVDLVELVAGPVWI